MTNRFLLVLVAGALVALMALGWNLLNTPVQTLTIKGDLSPLERERVAQVLSEQKLPGMLHVRLGEIQSVLKSLGWAHGVAVRRVWPARLVVTVEKLQPVARWADGGYLSADGEHLDLPDTHPGLPLFDVRLSTPSEAMEVFRLLAQIATHEGVSIDELHEDGQGEWRALLDDGVPISLGAEQLSERMRRVLLAYRTVAAHESRPIDYIDARYQNAIAVKYMDLEADNLAASVGSRISLSDGR
jgi:cell division protein FtsQ